MKIDLYIQLLFTTIYNFCKRPMIIDLELLLPVRLVQAGQTIVVTVLVWHIINDPINLHAPSISGQTVFSITQY